MTVLSSRNSFDLHIFETLHLSLDNFEVIVHPFFFHLVSFVDLVNHQLRIAINYQMAHSHFSCYP